VPATLVKFGNPARYSSPARRMSGLGSTPKTRLPFWRSNRVSSPVPDATSAIT